MAIINKLKTLDVGTSVGDIETVGTLIAEAFGCNYKKITSSDVDYCILTMDSAEDPNSGFAIRRDTNNANYLRVYPYINKTIAGADSTGPMLIEGTLYYLIDSEDNENNYILFGSYSSGKLVLMYSFIKGKDLTLANSPKMWSYHSLKSSSGSTLNGLWNNRTTGQSPETFSTSDIKTSVNEYNLTILIPIYAPRGNWIADKKAFYTVNRSHGYSLNQRYNLILNGRELYLMTGGVGNNYFSLCFDITDVPDILPENENEE